MVNSNTSVQYEIRGKTQTLIGGVCMVRSGIELQIDIVIQDILSIDETSAAAIL
jgi:hypothetical protein